MLIIVGFVVVLGAVLGGFLMAGGGFPRGLFNDAIPMPSRIIAVADAFDALTGHVADPDSEIRDAANAELVRYAGSHFDPTIVRAWLRVREPETVSC